MSCTPGDKKQKVLSYKLPSFSGQDFVSGKTYTDKTLFNGKYKLIYFHFWGTWCGPCEAEFPEFLEFSRKLQNKEIAFVALAVNDKDQDIKKFMKRFKDIPQNFIVIHDQKRISDLLGTFKLPETFLINNEKQFLDKYIGPQNWNSEYFFKLALKKLN